MLERTGLIGERDIDQCSLPTIYTYSEIDVHTRDLFCKCYVADTTELLANDDAQETFFIPTDKIVLADFGLHSIRVGLAKFLKEI